MKSYKILLKRMFKNNSNWLVSTIFLSSSFLNPTSAFGEWTNLGPGGGGAHRALAFSPGLDKKLILGADVGGIYISDTSSNYHKFSIKNQRIINTFINSLQFHPTDSNIVYAGTEGGVAKSTDGGTTWQMKRVGFRPFPSFGNSASVKPIAIDPNNPDIVYAGLGFEKQLGNGFNAVDVLGYVYKTDNGGDSWTEIEVGGIDDQSIMSIVIDPLDSSKLYLLSQYKFFKSTDGGITWVEQATLPYSDANYTSLVVKRDDPNVVLLSYVQRGVDKKITGLLKSIDNGDTWTEKLNATVSSNAGIQYIRMHPTENGTFFATFRKNGTYGLQRSTDAGDTWEKINDLNVPADNAWFPLSEKTTDVAVDPNNPDVICFLSSNNAAVYLSEDAGQNWEQISTTKTANQTYQSSGLNILVATDIVVHPETPDTMLIGYLDRTVINTTDGGQSFFKGTDPVYNQTAHVFSMAADPSDPDVVYVTRRQTNSTSTNTGVFRTPDFGESFQQIGGSANGISGVLIYDIEIDPLSSPLQRTIYVATGDAGVFKTSDSGGSWTPINSGLPSANVQTYDIAVDPTDSQIVYVGARVSSVSGYVAKSTDGGATWNIVLGKDEAGVTHYSEVDIRAVVVDPSNPNIIYAGNRDSQGKGVNKIFWRSEDKGANWSPIPGDVFNVGPFEWGASPNHDYHLQSITPDPANPGRVYAGFGVSGRDHRFTGGFYFSDDYGVTWQLFDDTGLQNYIIEEIVIDPQDSSRLYVASGGNGIYRYGPPPAPSIQAPVAVDDMATTLDTDPVVIDVLANDYDVDSGTLLRLFLTVTSPPASGSTSVDTLAGTITYTPQQGALGPVTFTYTVPDNENAVSNPATVTVTVTELDTDGDGLGNSIDPDDDNDSLLDTEEVVLGTDPLLADTDGDSVNDGLEVAAGTDPLNDTSTPVLNDGDANNDGQVNVTDLLIGLRILTAQTAGTPLELAHLDVAPLVAGVPTPDGQFNLGDYLVLLRKVSGAISF